MSWTIVFIIVVGWLYGGAQISMNSQVQDDGRVSMGHAYQRHVVGEMFGQSHPWR